MLTSKDGFEEVSWLPIFWIFIGNGCFKGFLILIQRKVNLDDRLKAIRVL